MRDAPDRQRYWVVESQPVGAVRGRRVRLDEGK
jgi:hypothetical protein